MGDRTRVAFVKLRFFGIVFRSQCGWTVLSRNRNVILLRSVAASSDELRRPSPRCWWVCVRVLPLFLSHINHTESCCLRLQCIYLSFFFLCVVAVVFFFMCCLLEESVSFHFIIKDWFDVRDVAIRTSIDFFLAHIHLVVHLVIENTRFRNEPMSLWYAPPLPLIKYD